MDEVTFPSLVRGLLIASSVTIGLALSLRLAQGNRWDTYEQRFLLWGALFSIIALGGRSVIAIQDGDGLVWPLAFFAAALVCFGVYLTSPRGRKK